LKLVHVRAWLPVLLWMLAIFLGSTDVLSSQHTSRVIGPLLRWIYPGVSETTIEVVQLVVRKCGHLTEYAVLAVLTRRAWHLSTDEPGMRWSWPKSFWALGLAALYAASDEFHQSFVPTRYASPVDVLIDTLGAAAGLALIWIVLKLRAK
jgi:VanZ family protein